MTKLSVILGILFIASSAMLVYDFNNQVKVRDEIAGIIASGIIMEFIVEHLKK